MSYASLHNHTEYSLQDGLGKVSEMLDRAQEIGIKGIALTEHGNVYSAPYLFKLKNKYPEIKFVYGVEFYECFDINIQDAKNKYFHLVALAKNENGRIAINELITQSELKGKYYKPRVDLDMLKPYSKDLIISSACLASKISKEDEYEKCVEYVKEYKSIFPHYYLELQSHKNWEQEVYNKKLIKLSIETGTPFIITTDSHVPTKEMLTYQAYHVQIARDSETLSESYEDCYLQSEEEIHDIMDFQIGYENVCKGLEETNKILEIIEDIQFPFQTPELPNFPTPIGFKDNKEYLRHLVIKGWSLRNFNVLSASEQTIRKERLEYELQVINDMGFNGYFLIIHDAIDWGKKQNADVSSDINILFGDGRGSAGGSIVCYLLGIVNTDPIKYNLIFERFLNPERIGLPDIDIDVYPREPIINYLKNKYGDNKVCQVLNFSVITPKVAIRDVARVLNRNTEYVNNYGSISLKESDKIAGLFTEKKFEDCLIENETQISVLCKDKKFKILLEIAQHISGRVRHVSIHAGAVCIVNKDINCYVPMMLGKDKEQVIQVDKRIVEEIGIVKFDFLGLKTLGVINEARKFAGIEEWQLDPNNPDFLNDIKMYDLIQSGLTNGIFQIESQGMKELSKRVKPKNLEEVSAILALYRPDAMDMLEDYIERKNDTSKIEYIHPDMESILKPTYGCIIYQEQVMDITRVFGGRTYGGADKFRKGIGKKDILLVQEEAHKLYEEIISNGYSKEIAKTISENLSNKGKYSFNKSHATDYATMTLKTAYLKANYPIEFYCAMLNSVYTDTGKLNKYIIESRNFGIEIEKPNINHSDKLFSIHNNKILFGLNSISGLGSAVTQEILDERKHNGKFKDMNDFLNRIKPKKDVMVKLIKSGAIPTKDKRNTLISYFKIITETKKYPLYKPVKTLPSICELNSKWNINTDIVVNKNERLLLYNKARESYHNTIAKNEWNLKQKILVEKAFEDFSKKYLQDEEFWEFEALSIFLKNNPFISYQEYIRQEYNDLEEGESCVLIGVISNVQKKKDRNKKDYAFIRVYGTNGIIEGIVWSYVYSKYVELLKQNSKLAFKGRKVNDESFIVENVKTLEDWVQHRKIGKEQ